MQVASPVLVAVVAQHILPVRLITAKVAAVVVVVVTHGSPLP
jgi:hypothetical protein